MVLCLLSGILNALELRAFLEIRNISLSADLIAIHLKIRISMDLGRDSCLRINLR